MTPEEVRQCVERGAALLDEKQPGWREKVDPEALEMRSPCRCVLGQLFGEYVDGLLEVFGRLDDASWDYGFNVSTLTRHNMADYVRLEAAWLELLSIPNEPAPDSAGQGLAEQALTCLETSVTHDHRPLGH